MRSNWRPWPYSKWSAYAKNVQSWRHGEVCLCCCLVIEPWALVFLVLESCCLIYKVISLLPQQPIRSYKAYNGAMSASRRLPGRNFYDIVKTYHEQLQVVFFYSNISSKLEKEQRSGFSSSFFSSFGLNLVVVQGGWGMEPQTRVAPGEDRCPV